MQRCATQPPTLVTWRSKSECTARRQWRNCPCESSAIPQTTGTITRLCMLLNSVPNRSHPSEKGMLMIFVHRASALTRVYCIYTVCETALVRAWAQLWPHSNLLMFDTCACRVCSALFILSAYPLQRSLPSCERRGSGRNRWDCFLYFT